MIIEEAGILHSTLANFVMDNSDDKSAVPRRQFRSKKRGKQRFQGTQFTDTSGGKRNRVVSSRITTMKSLSQGALRPTVVDKSGDQLIHSTPIAKPGKRSVSSRKTDLSLSPIKKLGNIQVLD